MVPVTGSSSRFGDAGTDWSRLPDLEVDSSFRPCKKASRTAWLMASQLAILVALLLQNHQLSDALSKQQLQINELSSAAKSNVLLQGAINMLGDSSQTHVYPNDGVDVASEVQMKWVLGKIQEHGAAIASIEKGMGKIQEHGAAIAKIEKGLASAESAIQRCDQSTDAAIRGAAEKVSTDLRKLEQGIAAANEAIQHESGAASKATAGVESQLTELRRFLLHLEKSLAVERGVCQQSKAASFKAIQNEHDSSSKATAAVAASVELLRVSVSKDIADVRSVSKDIANVRAQKIQDEHESQDDRESSSKAAAAVAASVESLKVSFAKDIADARAQVSKVQNTMKSCCW